MDPAAQDAMARLVAGTNGDPASVLGPRGTDAARRVTVFRPDAVAVEVIPEPEDRVHPLHPVEGSAGLFSGPAPGTGPYKVRVAFEDGAERTVDDPYRFGPVLDAAEARLIAEGRHRRLWTALGARVMRHEDVAGTDFAVWAPNALRVSVVGDFNGWDGRRHPMRRREGGIWELFLPGIGEGALYKYEIVGPDGTPQPLKADPVGFGAEHTPGTASVVRDLGGYGWSDGDWMATRGGRTAPTAPVSIYEVHLASWRRKENGRPISYVEAAGELVDYAAEMGFTHIELLPVSEHPFDGSWGYQPVGLYAPTVRHGPPHEFRDLIAAAHRRGLGVILDWVPGHFPTDPHGLARFDGTALYEYADPREGVHPDWNTLVYDYARPPVRNHLVSNALYWLEEYHADGLRVDAVASMLHRDFSRAEGDWVPNSDGGRENYEAMAMLREMNAVTRDEAPGIVTVAEESDGFPKVTAPADAGGLGFGYKWNMGWMHDTLDYIRHDPTERPAHHHRLTFGLTYAFSDRFVLAISHDEVVHEKGSMLGKMPGGAEERFANLRAYYGYMWGHPGKKLLFMGQEFGQAAEWDHAAQLDWAALDDPRHSGVRRLVRDLNTLYRATPALHVKDAEADGFQWIEADDTARSVYAWLRRGGPDDPAAAVICNFGREERRDYRIGLPRAGRWREAVNTDADVYGGAGRGNMGGVTAAPAPSHGQEASAALYLPPLSTLILVHEG
jgi:1,4-alpha-glucan branching enzyme